MKFQEYGGDDAVRYVVICDDCDLHRVYDEREPPDREIWYWGSKSKARENWSALSAAKGKRDDHNASVFVDYENGIRHSAHIEVVECD